MGGGLDCPSGEVVLRVAVDEEDERAGTVISQVNAHIIKGYTEA